MTEFEIWAYRGAAAGLIWFVLRFIKKQSDALENNTLAISRLTTILEKNDEMCKIKHENISKEIQEIKNKKR